MLEIEKRALIRQEEYPSLLSTLMNNYGPADIHQLVTYIFQSPSYLRIRYRYKPHMKQVVVTTKTKTQTPNQRRELDFNINPGELWNFAQVIYHIGFTSCCFFNTVSHNFTTKDGLSIYLSQHEGLGVVLEAEQTVNNNAHSSIAIELITQAFTKLRVKPINEHDYLKLTNTFYQSHQTNLLDLKESLEYPDKQNHYVARRI